MPDLPWSSALHEADHRADRARVLRIVGAACHASNAASVGVRDDADAVGTDAAASGFGAAV